MEGYYIFSDECGCYKQCRSEVHVLNHPFYIRSSIILTFSDYIQLEELANVKKAELNINRNVEIKWAEIGNRFNGRISPGTEDVSTETIRAYISFIIENACKLNSCRIFFSVFDNSATWGAREESMIYMHIQNALQRAQIDIFNNNGFGTMIIDDINSEQNRLLKEVCHTLLVTGDFVQYTNIKKSLLIDYSHHCVGLQLADYSAGILNCCLRKIKLDQPRNYPFASGLMDDHLYKALRVNDTHLPNHFTYGYGIKEVPRGCGKDICEQFAHSIDDKLDYELQRFIHELW